MVNVVLNRYKNLRHIGCLHSAGKGRIIMEYTFTAANFEEEVLQSELPAEPHSPYKTSYLLECKHSQIVVLHDSE